MKRINFRLIIALISVLTLLAVSCTDEDMNTIEVTPSTISFKADEITTKQLTITTDAPEWDFEVSDNNWITVKKLTNSINVTPKSFNTDIIKRIATITVTATSAEPVDIEVTQDGVPFGKSNYTATGTPLTLPNPAPNSWSGELEVNDELGVIYYVISNWANKTLLYLYYNDGQITLDGSTVLFEYDNLYICFAVGYIQGSNLTVKPASFQYEINYNSTTKTLDFSGTVDGKTAVVGLVGRNKTSGEVQTFYSDTFYSNAKLVLTPKSSSPSNRVITNLNNNTLSGKEKLNLNTDRLTEDTKIPFEKSKSFSNFGK